MDIESLQPILLVAGITVAVLVIAFISPRLAWALRHPFLATNWLQWFLSGPLRITMRNPRSNWPRRLFLILLPLELIYWIIAYVLLIPLRLLNAIYFNMMLFWAVTLRDGLADLLRPVYDGKTTFQYLLLWVILLPFRVLRLAVRYPWALLQGLVMTCLDLVWPTLTLFHGTSPDAANNITQSGQWFAGNGDWVGTGIYFGLSSETAMHYARASSGAPFVLARVTLAPCRPSATLPYYLRERIGRWQGDTISRGVRFPWVALEHWRDDHAWYEFCLVQSSKHTAVIPWRVRPICVVRANTPSRIPGGAAVWPKSFKGAAALALSLLALTVPIAGLVLVDSESVVTALAPAASAPGTVFRTTPVAPTPLAQVSTDTPRPPTDTPPPTPVPTICQDAPPTRLRIGSRARVITATTLRVRSSPRIVNGSGNNILLSVPNGTIVDILEGPLCAEGFAWWKVSLSDIRSGWVAEGDVNRYFLEPIN